MIDLNRATMGQVVSEVNDLLSLLPDDIESFKDIRSYYPEESPALIMLMSNKLWHDKVKYGGVVVTEDRPEHDRIELKAQLVYLHKIDSRLEELASEMDELEQMKINILKGHKC